ncbi:MAG TPA: alpha/beta hydrolase [Anaerolineaceae bacterium]|nr:alpha/beta hydrolase [Anaerolineaceae bacterium]
MNYLDISPQQKEAVLLLHGLGATGASWQLQIEALQTAGMRIIAPDLPGFGNSKYNSPTWSIRGVADILAQMMKNLVDQPVAVVGISMGGVIALQMGIDHPALVDRLVLVNTFARFRPDSIKGWLYFLHRAVLVSARGVAAQAPYVAKRIFPDPGQEMLRYILVDQILKSDPRVYRSAMRSLALFDSTRRLTSIKKAVLVISGECDTTIPVKIQRQLVERIPKARQVVIPQGGHAVIVDQPSIFNRVLLEFLQEPLTSTG